MTTGPQSQSASELLNAVLSHLANMAKGELALAQVELVEKLKSARNAAILFVVALALIPALIGLIFTTIVLALIALGLKPVWVALAVTCVLALTMIFLVMKARNLLRWGDLSASRTVQGLRRDAQTLKEIVRNDVSV